MCSFAHYLRHLADVEVHNHLSPIPQALLMLDLHCEMGVSSKIFDVFKSQIISCRGSPQSCHITGFSPCQEDQPAEVCVLRHFTAGRRYDRISLGLCGEFLMIPDAAMLFFYSCLLLCCSPAFACCSVTVACCYAALLHSVSLLVSCIVREILVQPEVCS